MKEFFTADLHLNHANIAGPSISNWDSGFRDFKTIDQMNEEIIRKINETVGQDDTLYIIGDLCFGDHTLTPMWRKRIICKNVIWLKGNHDKKQDHYAKYFTYAGDVAMITIDKQKIFMSHYKHAIWEGSHKGFWHLYGHSHAAAEDWVIGKSMDVGIDNARKLLGEYRPFSFDEIKRFMDKREIHKADHHGDRKNQE